MNYTVQSSILCECVLVITMEVQLESCVICYLNICDMMKEGYDALNSKNELLSAIFSINSVIDANILSPGRLCFAPRLASGSMDIAMIIKTDEELMTAVWIYPRNKYELSSKGFMIEAFRLRILKERDFEKLRKDIESLKIKNFVYAQDESGFFCPSVVVNIQKFDDSEAILEIKYSQDNINKRIKLKSTLTHIALDNSISQNYDSYNYSDDESVSSSASSQHRQSTSLETLQENIKYEKSMNFVSSLNILHENEYILGDWERHTKGGDMLTVLVVSTSDGVIMDTCRSS